MRTTFSVCIPVRNEASLISRAIDSVLEQTYRDFELVIGDNASDDGLADVVAAYDDPRVRYVRFDRLVPVNESWNRTVAACVNDWVMPLSADDLMYPECLEKVAEQVEKYDERDVVMVVGTVRRVDTQGLPDDIGAKDDRQQRPLPYRPIVPGLHEPASWLIENGHPGIRPYMPGSIAFRRSTIAESGFFRPEMGLCADVEIIVRMAAYGPVAYMSDTILDYTVRGDSVSNRFVLEDLHSGDRTTMGERAWLSAMRVHEQRREVTDVEKAAMRSSIARSHLQRAVWHRRLEAGQGRKAAMMDVISAARYSPRAVASPVRTTVLLGSILAPKWVIDKATVIGHRFGVVVV